MTPLPVDTHLDEIRDALDRHRAAVLVAAPQRQPGGGPTVVAVDALVLSSPALDPGIDEALQAFMAKRKEVLPDNVS